MLWVDLNRHGGQTNDLLFGEVEHRLGRKYPLERDLAQHGLKTLPSVITYVRCLEYTLEMLTIYGPLPWKSGREGKIKLRELCSLLTKMDKSIQLDEITASITQKMRTQQHHEDLRLRQRELDANRDQLFAIVQRDLNRPSGISNKISTVMGLTLHRKQGEAEQNNESCGVMHLCMYLNG